MKRVFWTVGVRLFGFFVGGMAGGRVGVVVGLIWGASIGYGLGAIFTQKRPTKGLVLWWVSTLALEHLQPSADYGLFADFIGHTENEHGVCIRKESCHCYKYLSVDYLAFPNGSLTQ